MNNINGFYGQISGPFAAGEEIFTKVKQQSIQPIDYISKLGIHHMGTYNLDINGIRQLQEFVLINGEQYQIGKTRMLELEDTQITSIIFPEDVDDTYYIDYQYMSV